MTHIVQNYLSLEQIPVTVDTVVDILPAGWNELAQVIVDASDLCGGQDIIVTIKNGTLYASGRAARQRMFDRILKTLLQESAKTCMVCGSSGLRRKEQVGSPPLCAKHYVEYINAI